MVRRADTLTLRYPTPRPGKPVCRRVFYICGSMAQPTISAGSKTAIVFGATGLTGGYLLRQLLEHPSYARVHAYGRRTLDVQHEKLQERVIDFDRLDEALTDLKGDDLYIALGTTIKKAGSREAFRRIDLEYPLHIAQIAQRKGVSQVMLVSSAGADPDSPFFYSRVKGELEQLIRQLPFWAVRIYRPSILMGKRDEQRIGESIGKGLGALLENLMGKSLGKYRPIDAKDLAIAMIHSAQAMQSGTFFYNSNEMVTLAKSLYAKLPDPT